MSIEEALFKEIKRSYPMNCQLNRLYDLCEGHKQGTVDRKLRLLAENGLVKKVENEKHHIKAYVYLPPTKQATLFNLKPNYQSYAN